MHITLARCSHAHVLFQRGGWEDTKVGPYAPTPSPYQGSTTIPASGFILIQNKVSVLIKH